MHAGNLWNFFRWKELWVFIAPLRSLVASWKDYGLACEGTTFHSMSKDLLRAASRQFSNINYKQNNHCCTSHKTTVGPYDFHDAENADGIAESNHKNGIYSLMRNVMEFVKVWIN